MFKYYGVIVIFPVHDKFRAIRTMDSGRRVCKLTFSLAVPFYLTNAENKTKNSQHTSHNIALSKGTMIAKKWEVFAKKILTSAKLKRL